MIAGLPLGVAFALGWIPMFLFRAEAVTEALPGYTGRERFWVSLTPLLLAGHVTAVCVTISRMPEVQLWRAAVGLSLFGGAIAFWFWGRRMIGPLRLRRLPDEAPHRLERGGAFGIVRHPLYFAYCLAAVAPLFVVPRFSFAMSYVLCCAALTVRARQEERRLRVQVGPSYEAYCREVKRLIPFVW